MTVRMVLADDHRVMRQALHTLLELDPELEVVGEAGDGAEALQLVQRLRPDIVLMDLAMPVMDGLEATVAIRREHPEIEVLALTSMVDDATVIACIRSGAIGYVVKDADAGELCRAIKAAAAGQVQLSPQIAAKLVREVRAPDSLERLTERELEVLQLLAQGRTNKEIARRLQITLKTSKAHVSSILSKLGVVSRTQAALHAVRMGLVSADTVAEG